MFKIGQILVAKDEYIDKHETLEDTAGVVLDYNPENDCLILGTIHPERYALGCSLNAQGCFYRHATREEVNSFNITAFEIN